MQTLSLQELRKNGFVDIEALTKRRIRINFSEKLFWNNGDPIDIAAFAASLGTTPKSASASVA